MAEEGDPGGFAITRRIRAGDERAFARFYDAWFAPTLALARVVSRRDEPWCLDIVQDVMFAVARSMPALASDEQVRAWMTRTVVNAVTDRIRSEQRRRRREHQAAVHAFERAADRGDEPWRDMADGERRQWLAANVGALPAADRELLEARFGGSGTVAAAAARLGITADAAHGRLRRVLAGLRQRAREWWHGS